MQLYKTNLASNEMMTIIGGFLGSVLFVFLLTVTKLNVLNILIHFQLLNSLLIKAIGNLEKIMFGHGFQTKLFPEGNFRKTIKHFAGFGF